MRRSRSGIRCRARAAPLRLCLGALVFSLFGGVASAQVDVFHSPDQSGINPGSAVEIPAGSVQPIHLFIDTPGPATTTGTVCVDGDGTEMCGFDFALESSGGVQFINFAPAPNVVYSLTPARLRLNAVEALTGITGSNLVGSLQVDTNGAQGGQVDLVEGEALDASLGEVPISPRAVVTVPEPGLIGFLAGLLGLVLMNKARGQSE